jgi:hypothetical protein
MTSKKPGTFTSDMQPENKRGRGKYNKLMDALKLRGYTEEQFYGRVIDVAMSEGGANMMREVLTRFCPASKPSSQPVVFDFPEGGTPVQKIDSIISGVASGAIPADIGKLVVDMVKASLDVEEVTELAARLEKLEEHMKNQAAQ